MIYKIDFSPDLCGASQDEIQEVVDDLNKECEILLNEKVRFISKEDNEYYTCKAEKRLMAKTLITNKKN